MKSQVMTTRLTLTMNKEVVNNAKVYAKVNRTSVAQLVEDYLKHLSSPKTDWDEQDISPELRALVGCIKLPKDTDYKEIYGAYLEEKYR